MWKDMSEEEKQPYVNLFNKNKIQYLKDLEN